MTNKEAIEELRELIEIDLHPCPPIYEDALNLAIKALEERPHGKWIDIDSRVNKAICSNCKGITLTEPYGKSNFCPNCGADMRGDNDGN